MALEAAFLELRDGLKRLAGQLQRLHDRVRNDCPDEAHCVPARINDAVPIIAGWLRQSRKEMKRGCAALKATGDVTAALQALTACDHSFQKLRRELQRELTRRDRSLDLADLRRRKPRTWSPWVDEVLPILRDVRSQAVAVNRSLSQCWKELAARAQPAIMITNVGIETQIIEPRKRHLIRNYPSGLRG